MMQDQNLTSLPQPATRYDGRLKVTGKATYAAEFHADNVAYGHIVYSTIASGELTSIDTAAAERASGVLAVLTPFNAPKLAQTGRPSILQSTTVRYNGEPIALVVASTLPQAVYAASLLRVDYKQTPAQVNFAAAVPTAHDPKRGPSVSKRGDVAAGLARADVKLNETYSTPLEYHTPMEMHSTIAEWDGDKLNVYDATQGISGVKQTLARAFNLPMDNVRVQCPYVGGGFGGKGSVWTNTILAAMAAKQIHQPVKIVIDRSAMFGTVGGRPHTQQQIALGADKSGKLLAISHDVLCSNSFSLDFMESSANQTQMLYESESCSTSHRFVDLNIGPGTWQRGPGESTGTFALESAMDELAYKLKMDPVQLRLVNYAEKDPSNGRPWSEKHLRECYTQAAERFGWSKRNPEPRSMKEKETLIGWGMATATYPGGRSGAEAQVRMMPDGRVITECGTQDLGTGTYTILAETAAAELGVDIKSIDSRLGDTLYPRAPGSGGSTTANTVCPAMQDAAMNAKNLLLNLAIADEKSPLHNAKPEDIIAQNGGLCLRSAPEKHDAYTAILARNGGQPIEAKGQSAPGGERSQYSFHSWGAVFAEVAVDMHTNMLKVRRVVATFDIGKLLNMQTGINQFHGGVVWGVGQALLEEGIVDTVYGRMVNGNFGDYHVPVNADIGEVDVTVVNIPDYKANTLGARGIGEIGITGVAAAIANAVYHATGKRVRDLPITLDKLMA